MMRDGETRKVFVRVETIKKWKHEEARAVVK
jgi:hypothetical protein